MPLRPTLVVCPACACYVKSSECACPSCGTCFRSLERKTTPAAVILAMGLVSAACSSNVDPGNTGGAGGIGGMGGMGGTMDVSSSEAAGHGNPTSAAGYTVAATSTSGPGTGGAGGVGGAGGAGGNGGTAGAGGN